MGFPFLFAICTAAMITICFVNVEKGREDGRKFAEARKIARVSAESGLSPDSIIKGASAGGFDQETVTSRGIEL